MDRFSESFYEKMLENLFDGVYFVDNDRRITFWNKGAERISGFKKDELQNKHCHADTLNHIDQSGRKLCFSGCPLHKTLGDGETRESEVYLHHKDGHRVLVDVRTFPIYEEDVIVGAVEIFNERVSEEQMIKSLRELEDLAMTDELTNLPNRRYLNTYIESKLNEAKVLQIPIGIAMLDIDHFKHVNDTYGHATGDEVLKMVSKTFRTVLRKADIVGRFGGEEFVAVFSGIDAEDLAIVCEKLRFLTKASKLRDEHHKISVTISIGATLYKKDDTIESIISRADSLLYCAKEQGRNRFIIG